MGRVWFRTPQQVTKTNQSISVDRLIENYLRVGRLFNNDPALQTIVKL